MNRLLFKFIFINILFVFIGLAHASGGGAESTKSDASEDGGEVGEVVKLACDNPDTNCIEIRKVHEYLYFTKFKEITLVIKVGDIDTKNLDYHDRYVVAYIRVVFSHIDFETGEKIANIAPILLSNYIDIVSGLTLYDLSDPRTLEIVKRDMLDKTNAYIAPNIVSNIFINRVLFD